MRRERRFLVEHVPLNDGRGRAHVTQQQREVVDGEYDRDRAEIGRCQQP
jgi:hypothetical protein